MVRYVGFQVACAFTYGNSGAYTVDGDGRQNWDFSLGNKFYPRENHFVELRGEFFNLLNHVNFDGPNTSFSSSAFGKVTNSTSARQVQLALRYQF